MSRLGYVIREKGRREKEERARRKQEMQEIRKETAYKARLEDDMNVVRVALSDPSVTEVQVEVPQAYVTQFMKAAYGDEMAEYTVIIDGSSATIRRRVIQI